jgi:hypothetical protein
VATKVALSAMSVVMDAAATSAYTALPSPPTTPITTLRMAMDQLDPSAHRAENRTACRTTPIASPLCAASWYV